MAETDSRTPRTSGEIAGRETLRRLNRALTTLRLGVPLFEEVLHPADSGPPTALQELRAATLAAVLELTVLSGQLVQREIGIAAPSPGPSPTQWGRGA